MKFFQLVDESPDISIPAFEGGLEKGFAHHPDLFDCSLVNNSVQPPTSPVKVQLYELLVNLEKNKWYPSLKEDFGEDLSNLLFDSEEQIVHMFKEHHQYFLDSMPGVQYLCLVKDLEYAEQFMFLKICIIWGEEYFKVVRVDLSREAYTALFCDVFMCPV